MRDLRVWITAAVLLFSPLPALASVQNASENEYVPGEAVVVVEAGTSGEGLTAMEFGNMLSSSAERIASAAGGDTAGITAAIASVTGKNIILVRSTDKTTEELLAELRKNPAVLSASPNYKIRLSRTPDDPYYTGGQQWGMTAVRAPAAWDRSVGSSNVYVVVIDSGIKYDHPDLIVNMGRDLEGHFGRVYLAESPVGYDPMDDNGHGTHVAGIIGAKGNNGIGVAGVNWNVKLLAVKVLDEYGRGYFYNLVSGLEYVTDQKRRGLNIRVANMSLGVWYNRANADEAAAINAMNTACEAVSSRGVMLTVASGNEYQDISNPGGLFSNPDDLLADYRGKLPYPASFRHANMITVTAINSSYRRPDFANYSSRYVHLAAPGVGIWSTYHNGGYTEMNGTSMATPYVAGAAALLSAMFPSETAGQIRSRILGNVTRISNLSGLVSTGGYLNIQGAVTNETPSDGGGGGGCSAAGGVTPAVALLLLPLGLLMRRKK
ncbi:Subtilisin amylosacchariticus [bioreactor metagenome]|uniref:Subtilisin amylosacchariticus n=1 Tax=bioreactor metagenome TaxID=1076179 RepID=A0A644W2X5_9ZZZZ